MKSRKSFRAERISQLVRAARVQCVLWTHAASAGARAALAAAVAPAARAAKTFLFLFLYLENGVNGVNLGRRDSRVRECVWWEFD